MPHPKGLRTRDKSAQADPRYLFSFASYVIVNNKFASHDNPPFLALDRRAPSPRPYVSNRVALSPTSRELRRFKVEGGRRGIFRTPVAIRFYFFRLNRSSERFGGHLLFARTLDDASNGAFGFRFALTISEKRLIVYKPDERRSAFRSRFGSRTAFRTRRRRRRVPISIRRRVICL